MKEVLASETFKVISKGSEIEIIQKLIELINQKVEEKWRIPLNSEIDWQSDALGRIFINENITIRTWNICPLKKKGESIGFEFRVSLFFDE